MVIVAAAARAPQGPADGYPHPHSRTHTVLRRRTIMINPKEDAFPPRGRGGAEGGGLREKGSVGRRWLGGGRGGVLQGRRDPDGKGLGDGDA